MASSFSSKNPSPWDVVAQETEEPSSTDVSPMKSSPTPSPSRTSTTTRSVHDEPSQIPRRRLYSTSDDLRLAVPLSCEIWNLVLPSALADMEYENGSDSSSVALSQTVGGGGGISRWYQLQHQSSIVEPIELQIVVQEEMEDVNNENENDMVPPLHDEELQQEQDINVLDRSTVNVSTKETVLYRGVNDNGKTVYPCWFHLQEKLSENKHWKNLHRDTYEKIEFRFCTVSTQRHPSPPRDSLEQANQEEIEEDNPCFLNIPVHPSQLVSLGDTATYASLQRCPTLPINTLVVHFSDQSTRILPHHFQLLSQHHPTLFPSDPLLGREDISSSLSSNQYPRRHHHHHHHHHQSSLEPQTPKDSKENDGEGSKRPRFKEDAFKALGKNSDLAEKEKSKGFGGNDPVGETENQNVDCRPSRQEVMKQDLQREQRWLLRQLEEEKKQHQKELEELARMQANIRDNLQASILELEEQTKQIRQATQEERKEGLQLDLAIESHRIRLVRGLQAFFPVQKNPTSSSASNATTSPTASSMSSYLISSASSASQTPPGPTLRGWTLPSAGSLFSAATDEELSAVLGVLSHVVQLLGKYLGVALRYRIFSNSSRSAIQDDRGIIHPLFLARPVEREQVEQGLVLLERNLTCIAQARGVPLHMTQSTHVFEKVLLVYQATVHDR